MPQPNPALTVQVAHRDGSVVIAVIGELDLATAPLFVQRVAGELGPGDRPVIIDLRHLTFVDVCGLRGLLEAKQNADAADTPFRLKSVTAAAFKVIGLAGFSGDFAGIIELAET